MLIHIPLIEQLLCELSASKLAALIGVKDIIGWFVVLEYLFESHDT